MYKRHKFRKILLAYDGSELVHHTLDCARDLAHQSNAQVILVHAFHPIPKEWGKPLWSCITRWVPC